jgi:hypothetical protein
MNFYVYTVAFFGLIRYWMGNVIGDDGSIAGAWSAWSAWLGTVRSVIQSL